MREDLFLALEIFLSLFLFLCWPKLMARWGGFVFSFCFSFIALASKLNFAFNAYHFLSWWYGKTMSKTSGFVDFL